MFVKIFPKRKGIDEPRYEGPYKVIKIKGKWCYVLKNCRSGKIVERNYYHVKRFRGAHSGSQRMAYGKQELTSIWSATERSSLNQAAIENGNKTVAHGVTPRRSGRIRKNPDWYR